MDNSDPSHLLCPVGEPDCRWLDEIVRLRKQVVDLSDLVSTDALTGVYNFRYFRNVLQSEMDRSKRSGIPTSLVMADLDHFKTINDAHGHEVGNLALRQIANIIKQEIRTTDSVCRYGGGVFAMIFPETHLNLAVKVADRIRELIAFTPVEYNEGVIDVTVSMGASVYMKTSILNIDIFVDSVDKYMYEAK
ncbi:MAG: GGDEF domain-containing protein, partial [Gammaproteobacteria bacterium]|nr:GGDEF domain-containing protein [Gammaproteobacteria bacterium]